ncbi:Phenazine biosynthesis protein PhzF like [hydrothermal vent metagenome]|uniref:Phenazine biosynthesis protein PhzF like n=1 Tax=hydrothermal vent metagenome TaxID=652676 RepID=A0A3B1AYT8_9ZZZZ
MSEYSIFQVDAFTSQIFRGNPAAVVPMADWGDDGLLQNIARENNLSETAFFTRVDDDDVDFHLRWFTPVSEVDLCGHATLAAAHVLFKELDWYEDILKFSTQQAGTLIVKRCGDGRLQLDFPARPGMEIDISEDIIHALGIRPERLFLARDHMAVFASEAEVAAAAPHMERLAKINEVGVIVTAPADQPDIDFVSRFFAPSQGIPEDPVTGSAHCSLIPYWAERLGKTTLTARQISARAGDLQCCYLAEEGRVHIAGYSATYLKGTIFV